MDAQDASIELWNKHWTCNQATQNIQFSTAAHALFSLSHTQTHTHSYAPKTIVYWQAFNDQYFSFNLKNFYLYNQWFSMEKLFHHTNTWSPSLYNAEIGVSACGIHKKLFYYIFTVFNFFFLLHENRHAFDWTF